MKKILMIGTGGTIASRQTENGLAPGLTPQDILSYIPTGGASMRGGNVSGVQYRQYECDTGTLEAYRRGGRRKI